MLLFGYPIRWDRALYLGAPDSLGSPDNLGAPDNLGTPDNPDNLDDPSLRWRNLRGNYLYRLPKQIHYQRSQNKGVARNCRQLSLLLPYHNDIDPLKQKLWLATMYRY
jgi:hypothetical protein